MMELITISAIRRVAVCGGTHGNELTGVYLVPELERQRSEKGDTAWPVPVTTVLSNLQAIQKCKRYVDKDLNRCFTSAILSSPVTDATPYEVRRAQELNSLLGPKGTADATDEKITKVPVRIILLNIPTCDAYSLESVAKHGISLEAGPQPHGVVRADIFNVMKQGVDLVLDWIKHFNSGKLFEGGDVDVFMTEKSVDYPRDTETQKPLAAIHPQLQDQDFCLLKRGDPLFLMFSGETVRYDEEEPLHPFFINEAAYYEKGIAFHLARKKTLTLPSLRMKRD